MPVILAPDAERQWLDSTASLQALDSLLSGLPSSEIALTEVGPAVNDARYDGPECLAPPVPAAQGALFD
jgi:putative SOS response-associated peptidase YedK